MKRNYKLQSYVGKDGQHFWRVVAPNGNIVADGGEGYKLAKSATKGFQKLVDAIKEDRIVVDSTN